MNAPKFLIKIYLKAIVTCIVITANVQVYSQKIIEQTSAEQRLKWYDQNEELKENSLFKNLPWQFIGPTNVSGRMTDVAVVSPKGKNYTIYAAGASGGIWKTDNEGTTWVPVFENAMSTSIGDLAIDPQNPNTIWAGTGEANIFRSSQAGAGIYRSKDAGKTWEHLGLISTNTISRIIVHPTNSDIVYVAAGGHEWTNNKDRGLYKTIDGGKSWKNILYIDDKTAANDLIMDPNNPEILYASTWQRIRKHWNDPRSEKNYTGSALYKSIDGGNSWNAINSGLPAAADRGRIGIDLCKAQPNVLYAFVDNYERLEANKEFNDQTDAYGRPSSGRIKGATVYRSDNSGESWKQVSEESTYMENISGTYGWVFGQVRVDPINPDKVYVMGLALNVSTDGGKSFKPLRGMHSDHHGLWIDPENTDYLVNVNDGGIAISYDGGKNFRTFYNNLPLVQFFNVNYDMDEPFHVYGSIQDHGSRKGVVNLSQGRSKIPSVAFSNAPGGEGSNHFIDPTNPDIVYSAGFYGTITRSNVKTGVNKNIMPPVPDGIDKLRGQWLAPFIISPHNSQILYHGTQVIHRSFNMGETWEQISPDLTYNLEEKKGDIPYQTIFSISESTLKFGLLYAGTDDGRIWITKNSGTNWKEINKGLPYRKWISQVEASKFELGTVYLTQNGKHEDDFTAYIWKSTDFGETWKDISTNIPCGPVNVIREDPQNKNILYVGTDFGAYVSINGGQDWNTLSGNFPTTYVHDLVVHPRDNILVAATHGRGIWAMDVSYIQNLNDSILNLNCEIINISEAQLPYSPERWYANTAKFPQIGFYLEQAQSLTISIKNIEDKIVFESTNQKDKGLNFLEWKLQDSETKKLVNEGKYTLIIKGETFELKKEFNVLAYKD
ncbi:MAG: hypothetical protein CVU00_07020 [Bacteroidetes bacterium HGW-Bacteroidetes-17]|nr:MAG: hypothetical protein CVU00_07020 [Bacteroidetes bacterium HGW-Bacteroidetes-17]